MDIQFYGANCVTLTHRGIRIVVDDTLESLGGKAVVKADDIVLYTSRQPEGASMGRLMFDGPGEYEVADVSIVGIPEQAHLDPDGQRATMFKVITNDFTVLLTGHVYPSIKDDQLERIGVIDILIIPVGGNGYTLDPIGALKLIKEIEPKIVIPTHYADSSLKYEVPQIDLASALIDLGMEPKQQVGKLKLKPADLTDITQLIVLEKS